MTSADAARPLVGIVPNFSEGRRADVIEAIVEALRVPGVLLLNRQADPDHNRLDCTLVGAPDAVRASALAGAAKAVELIDMEAHEGSHPRMGAVDVIPFMPVRDITMEACVELARSFGQQLAEELDLPVYLYDHAALVPERASLAEVRRGEYESLREAVVRGERLPDLGPHEFGRAGAVAVGARKPLIAFNVYLSGTEDAAGEIARTVRESSGGLPHVRAIGFAVPERGCVTVSMNLVDHEATPIHVAYEAVKVEAARRGMGILETEIVGLVPEAALDDAATSLLRLTSFDPGEQVLERLVARADAVGALGAEVGPIRARTLEHLLEGLASSDPTPGGGSAAAAAGAAAAALVGMVGRLTAGKEAFADVSERMVALIEESDREREAFLDLADRDAAAFDEVMDALRLPKGTDDERAVRAEDLQRAFRGAAEVPMECARRAALVLVLAREAVERGNPNAASDAAAAAYLAHAALGAALANVEINLASLRDETFVAEMRREAEELRSRGRASRDAADQAFARRVGSS